MQEKMNWLLLHESVISGLSKHAWIWVKFPGEPLFGQIDCVENSLKKFKYFKHREIIFSSVV